MLSPSKTDASEAITYQAAAPDAQEDTMVREALAAGNIPGDLSMDALLRRRDVLLGALDSIDREIERRGVRPLQRVVGRPRTVTLQLAAALADGPRDVREVAAKTGQSIHACYQMLSKLTASGELRRVERGRYALAGGDR